MTDHFIIKCQKCKCTITTCRCPAVDKPVRWTLCDKCDAGAIPEQIPASEIDWSQVIIITHDIIRDIYNGSHRDDNDDQYYVYEAAMQAVYGKNIFSWINKNI